MSGNATFTGILNGRYVDAITGDVKNVTDGKLTATCSGKGNLRVYVLDTEKTKAPGKVGEDGKYLYGTASVDEPWTTWPDETMPDETWTEKPNPTPGPTPGGDREEPEVVTEPAMAEGEQAVFFEHESWNPVTAWIFTLTDNFTGGNWPGENLTYLGNNVYKWTYTGTKKIPAGTKVIFSNAGSNQCSKDGFDFVNGGYYTSTGYVKTIEGAGDIPDTPVEPGQPSTFKVYYNNSDTNWSTVNVWIWDANNGDKNYTGGHWPGVAMTIDPETGYYTYSCVVTDPNPKMMVIFNHGSIQSANFDLVNNGIYTFSGFSGEQVATEVNTMQAANMRIWTAGGRLVIESPEQCAIVVASADGTVRTVQLHVGRNDIDLPRGLYIVAGKKVIL